MGDEGERAFERFRPLNRSPTRSFFVLAIVDREKERGRGRESKVPPRILRSRPGSMENFSP